MFLQRVLLIITSLFLVRTAQAHNPLTRICTLSKQISESSGLLYVNAQVYTHNDSKDKPCIYRVDCKTGKVLQWIYLKDAKNMDWEDMTSDGLYVYVGDFGNNNGKHRQRTIYRCQLPKIKDGEKDTVICETIHFNIPIPANDAEIRFNRHPYDMEAMTVIDSKLIVFTKDWLRGHCKAYSIPCVPGHYVAQFIDSFDAKGLITGACYDDANNKLYLIGYTTHGQGFLYNFQPTDKIIFQPQQPRINLSYFAQFEAICMRDKNTLYLSNERLPWSAGCLWRFDLDHSEHKVKASFGNRLRRVLWDFVYWGTHLR